MNPSNNIPFSPTRWPFFYGWMILLWGAIGVILSVPGQTTGVSAFIEPLLQSLHISRDELSLAYMIGTLSSGLLLTPAGKLFDRVGSRWMGFGSCATLGIVLILLSRSAQLANRLAQFLPETFALIILFSILFFLLRLSGQGILTLTSRNMIMKWFVRQRGFVSGITGACVAFSFSLAPSLFSAMIEKLTWSGTWQMSGLILLFIFAPLVWLFFRDNPEDCGLLPDGGAPSERADTTRQPDSPVYSLKEACYTFAFWPFSLTLAIQALALTAISFNIESIFVQGGMAGEQGFKIFPPAAIISVIINLIGGWLSDRMQLRWLLALMLLAMGSYLTALMFLRPGWPIILLISAYGLSNGLFGILMSVTWPRYYGRKHIGAISGLCMTLIVIFSAIGPYVFSLTLNHSGTYQGAHAGCFICTCVLFISSFFAREPVAQTK